jgi:UrcA family protein
MGQLVANRGVRENQTEKPTSSSMQARKNSPATPTPKRIYTMTIQTKLIQAIALGTTLVALNSYATPQKDDTSALSIQYSQSELADSSGQESLYQRLDEAVHSVCGSSHFSLARSLHQPRDNGQCYRRAMNKALDSIGSNALIELHNS